jgi:uncharacterized membrane protein
MHTIVGLAMGIAIGVMDFTLAKSVTKIVRLVNLRTGQAILVSGFIFRMGAIGILLWTMSRASTVNFMAVCVGLLSAFTVLALVHTIRAYTDTVRVRKQLSDRR